MMTILQIRHSFGGLASAEFDEQELCVAADEAIAELAERKITLHGAKCWATQNGYGWKVLETAG